MLREFRNRKAIELSGGQQKQLEVARAHLLDPKLILIDEPSIGLSPNLVQEVFRTLTQLQDHCVTILMVNRTPRPHSPCQITVSFWNLARPGCRTARASLLEDPRVGQLFLGGHVQPETSNAH